VEPFSARQSCNHSPKLLQLLHTWLPASPRLPTASTKKTVKRVSLRGQAYALCPPLDMTKTGRHVTTKQARGGIKGSQAKVQGKISIFTAWAMWQVQAHLILSWPAQALGSIPGRNAPDKAAAVTGDRLRMPVAATAFSLLYRMVSSCSNSEV